MCSRIAQFTDPSRLCERFGVMQVPPDAPPRYNGAPTEPLLVLRHNPAAGQRQLDALRWGLVPLWAKDAKAGARMINARAESLATSPAFRDCYRRRRCLVPVDAFFEWMATPTGKQPYAVAAADGAPLALAGLWERWRGADGQVLRSFAIVTVAANDLVAPLHDRMPAIIAPADWPLWLGETPATADQLAALLRPYPSQLLRLWPVSRRLNKPGVEGADLLDAE